MEHTDPKAHSAAQNLGIEPELLTSLSPEDVARLSEPYRMASLVDDDWATTSSTRCACKTDRCF